MMTNRKRSGARTAGGLSFLLGIAVWLAATSLLPAAKPMPAPMDLTRGGKKDESHDWLLGPTGARGWMFFRHEDLTAASRQILVTAVEPDSPAEGVLRVNDVILGVFGKPFSEDARKSFGRAIAAAEEKTGSLPLMIWRDGITSTVELKLQYSEATARPHLTIAPSRGPSSSRAAA